MELISHSIVLGKISETWRFYFLGDLHYGTTAFDEGHLKRTVAHIAKDKTARVFLLGDLAECINYTDGKRFDPRNLDKECLFHLDDLARFQVQRVTEMLAPIADKIICTLDGNHEESQRKYQQVDFNWRLRDNLNDLGGKVKYGGDIALVRVRFVYGRQGQDRTRQCVFLMSHGFGAGRTKGSKINRLMEMTYIIPPGECDGYFMAHHHDKVTDRINFLKPRYLRNNAIDVENRKAILGLTGCYYKTYQKGQSNYASKRLYRPTDLGAIYAEVKPFHGGNHAGDKTMQLDCCDLLI